MTSTFSVGVVECPAEGQTQLRSHPGPALARWSKKVEQIRLHKSPTMDLSAGKGVRGNCHTAVKQKRGNKRRYKCIRNRTRTHTPLGEKRQFVQNLRYVPILLLDSDTVLT